MTQRLEDYLSSGYVFEVIPAEEGGYLVRYPDLPGCFAQVEEDENILEVATDILGSWLTVALEDGDDIPMPRAAHAYSGKFVLRVPRSMHAALATAADREGVSTNSYIVSLLAERHTSQTWERRFEYLCDQMDHMHNDLRSQFGQVSGMPEARPRSPLSGSSSSLPMAA